MGSATFRAQGRHWKLPFIFYLYLLSRTESSTLVRMRKEQPQLPFMTRKKKTQVQEGQRPEGEENYLRRETGFEFCWGLKFDIGHRILLIPFSK